jgi:hypothetical protein
MPAITGSQEYPTLNGIAPSWADITTVFDVVDGASVKDIDYAGFKYNSTVEVGAQMKGGVVVKRTTGQKKDEASATFYKSGLRQLMDLLAATAPTRGARKLIGLVPFSISIQHSPPGADPSDIYEVRLRGCRLLKIDETLAEGTDAEKVEIDLAPIEVIWLRNGVELALL